MRFRLNGEEVDVDAHPMRRLLDVLRAASAPVEAAELDAVWDDAVQRSRCLDSLLVDGLVVQTDGNRFALPE